MASAAGSASAQVPDQNRIAEGNGDGADAHLFRPAVDSKGFFSVNGADILGQNNISLGLVLDYGHALMPFNEGHGTDNMVEHQFQGTIQFNYGIKNILVVGLQLPVVVAGAKGGEEAVTDIGPGGGANYNDDEIQASGVGNAGLHAKLRILRPETAPIGLAAMVTVGTGLGGSRDWQSDPGLFYWPQLVAEKRFGLEGGFRLGANVGFRGHTGANPTFGLGADGRSQLENGVLEYNNLITFGLGASLRVIESLDIVAEGYGTQLAGGASDSKQKLSAEVVGGLKVYLEKRSFLILGGGVGVTPGFQSAAQRAFLGIIFEPSIGDRDGDGIKDDEDDCPDEAEDFDGFEDTKADSPKGKYGCPDPDNDGDGILDVNDRCKNNAEDKDGDEDEDGCPEGSDGDRDGDGILDAVDKCPDNPEDRDGFEDKDGCPEPDNDKDGIPDVKDNCPNDPEDKDGWQDEDGCPDLDNDGDGIPDARDKCPNEKETFNGKDDQDGCPDDDGKVIIQGNDVIILEKVQFATGSAKILPQSFPILDAVASTLKGHPEFTLLEVQGHADERGNDATNLALTAARSKSVLEALVQRGVERNRLNAMGYGEYCPLDAASNADAWEKNRRVEFKIVKTNSGPTGVELGCPKATQMKVISTSK